MSFTLEETRLWSHMEGMAIAFPPFIPKRDNSKDQIEKIYVNEEKICKFQDNTCKAIAKIRKMCTEKVQNKFLLVKT